MTSENQVHAHRQQADRDVVCHVITVSDTRTEETDKSGKKIKELLTANGHSVARYEIVPDEKVSIQQAVLKGIADSEVEAVIINGGTGIAERDVTIEAVTPLFEKELPGFGEIFRYLSYAEDIGSAAIMSRAAAGVAGRTVIFSVPGSTGAVTLAMNKLILQEAGHIISELNKDQ
ncbi:MogA/MoaB family molybdenum cofactor biosynthesis protein [Bacillus thermotolerans]|uniref:Molybdenum cofactor biosynthesis protein B n=1 Tax=Bacillus thermotolerans TaxID=1221996 RepID=A0A0F5HLR0_BACTR|nr:MogA/MoaB family molybdenum cofactor biosynthesis protein [Bacillus thermotolerans]KKB34193.1 Molybdenum cofactor biosynthesis protein MoaB [Bacillus thermotolerans]KKB39078.1 Molybdenum cofactor biosynthesis protein MoaB [Bacillus thermotolerans]